jgi:hypothetical protein
MNVTHRSNDFSVNLLIRGKDKSELALDCLTTLREIDRIKKQSIKKVIEYPLSPLKSAAFPLKDIPTSRKYVNQNVLEIRSQYRFFIKTWIINDIQKMCRKVVNTLSSQLQDIGSRAKFSLTIVPPALLSNSQIQPNVTMHRNWLVSGSLFLCSPIYNRLENLDTNIQNQLSNEVHMSPLKNKTFTFSNLVYREQNLQPSSDAEILQILDQFHLEEKSTNINCNNYMEKQV